MWHHFLEKLPREDRDRYLDLFVYRRRLKRCEGNTPQFMLDWYHFSAKLNPIEQHIYAFKDATLFLDGAIAGYKARRRVRYDDLYYVRRPLKRLQTLFKVNLRREVCAT